MFYDVCILMGLSAGDSDYEIEMSASGITLPKIQWLDHGLVWFIWFNHG